MVEQASTFLTFQFAVMNDNAFGTGIHPLNMYLAEELSHLYLMAQASEDRQRDMRNRLELTLEENTRCNQSRDRISARLRQAAFANAGLADEVRSLRRDLANRERTITRLQETNDRYRDTFAQGLRQRAFPQAVRPVLQRIRAETENTRMEARLDLVRHFRALRNRVIAELPTTDEEATTDDGQETESEAEEV